jgi:lipopolysaccharide transport system ATP-binding protein
MSSRTVISVENLSKAYKIMHQQEQPRYVALRDVITEKLRLLTRPRRRLGSPASKEDFWALKNVSLEVKEGEVVGIIGRNGAGKSTLLKILSRITEPSRGCVRIKGRVASLLEVGTGFHPELTGRENIFLNGAILGMSRAETKQKFAEIVDFAEVEKFLDTAVKHYSSGMYMRLAFAVAAHLQPEILIVDEVLAVGDSAFQSKCLGKMQEVATNGRTVLFVSHNLGAIARLCGRAIWLDTGEIRSDDRTRTVLSKYQAGQTTLCVEWTRKRDGGGRRECTIEQVRIGSHQATSSPIFDSDSVIPISIDYTVARFQPWCAISTRLYNSAGLALFTSSDPDGLGCAALPKEAGKYRGSFTIPARLLAPGIYSLYVAAHSPSARIFDLADRTIIFEVTMAGSLVAIDDRLGLLAPLLTWTTTRLDA